MGRLFAEAFVVPLLPVDSVEPQLRYDEERALNVLPDGRPFIELGSVSGTETKTFVRAEVDDCDRTEDGGGDPLALATLTKVQAERDDFARAELSAGTETRMPGEKDDFDRDAFVATMTETAIGGEPTDDDRDARGSEGFFSLGMETKTSVRGEADDFWSEADEPAVVGPALLQP